MGDGDGSDGAGRARLVRELAAVHANLARLRVPSLLDEELALRLDDDDLATVIRAERHNLARVAAAIQEAEGYVRRRRS